MNIAIGSIFRDAAGHVDRYAAQVRSLQDAAPQHNVRVIVAEGDSVDNTWDLLCGHFGDAVFKRAHGGPKFGSVDSKQRYEQFSFCYEAVLERVLPTDDVFIYVEGDLVWDAATMLGLLENLELPEVDMVVPFAWYNGRHYDLWAVRGLDGGSFGMYPPHHISMLDDSPTGLYPLSSAGSCMVMKAEIARTCHFVPKELCVVGFTRDAVAHGYKIWLNPKLKVHHL